MNRSLIAVVMVVAACSADADPTIDLVFDVCQPLVLEPDATAGDEELAAIDEAARLWNQLGESRVGREPIEGAARLPIRWDDAAASFHGLYDDEHGIVFVNRALTDARERAIVISHELGHAFGLLHVPAAVRVSVMQSGNLTIEPNPGDRDALAEIWGDCP